jgi:hypothetical protein
VPGEGRKAAKHSVASRVRGAHERERALAALPETPRTRAAVRDAVLAELAGADGVRALARTSLARLAARHPRAGGALRDLAVRALALRKRRR